MPAAPSASSRAPTCSTISPIAAKPEQLAALRRLVVAQQGFASRFRRARPVEVEAAIRRLSAVQLDSISTVDRAHRLTLSARIGAIPDGSVERLLREGRIFEYWGHEASLLPI